MDGREAELLAAVGGAPGTIPLDCGPPLEMRADAATTVPAAGTGVNVAPISPYVFSESIAPMLGIDMPSAPSGSYSEPVITTALTAGVQPKGGTQESTAATIANRTAAPRRITGRLTLQLEDLAAFGNETYESALRQNLAAVLSDQYDRQAINGDGTGNNVNGLIAQLADPDDPTDVSDFDAFVAAVAGGVDGLWAKRLADVFMLVNPDTYRVAARSFRDRVIDSTAEKEVRAAASLGDVSVADYLEEKAAGFRTNARMPATSSDIARAIIYKMGRPAMRTACHPTWGTMQIEDIYTDSGAGQIHVTLHALVGSAVLLIQSAAYSLVEFKTA
ncbi:MAG: phage major capsid protein [Acidobacteria bacterium]|nr:phage major capsid protein [Acidobacteriota bacterium]